MLRRLLTPTASILDKKISSNIQQKASFGFFTIRGRLLRSLITSVGFNLSKKAEINAEGQKNERKLERMNKSTYEECDKDLALNLAHTTKIIQQALKDAGFNGPVHVHPYAPSIINFGKQKDYKQMEPINVGAFQYKNELSQTAAYVVIAGYPHPKKIDDFEAYFREAYASGAHVAGVVLNNHQTLKATIKGAIIGFTPIPGLIFSSKINDKLEKIMRSYADLYSAWKLGTGSDQIIFLTKAKEYEEEASKDNYVKGMRVLLGDNEERLNPLDQRIKILKYAVQFFKSEPAQFLTSEALQQIKNEREEFEKNKNTLSK